MIVDLYAGPGGWSEALRSLDEQVGNAIPPGLARAILAVVTQ